jgi:NAD(P)-dependent dehydrogenase (short-subunit alcohol dehydrogenase family)
MPLGSEIFTLKGRVALVTGGAGWLGAPMVTGLCEAGAHVIIVGRRHQPLVDLAKQLNDRGLSADGYSLDVTDKHATLEAIDHLRQTYGRLDVLVNNAAALPPGPRGLDAPDSSFSAATESSITAAWRLTTNSLDLLRNAVRECGDASVINIGSMYGKVSPDPKVYLETGEPPNPACYVAAKAGLIQLTRWLACNLGHEKIRVNSISPGPFPQWNARDRSPEFVARLDAKTALGRVGDRDEIKGPVVFLASHAASFITGADIPVDGGWTSF